jgi:hypothetical protein
MPTHARCGDCLVHSLLKLPLQSIIHGIRSQVHLQFYVDSTDRNGGDDYCPLAAALVQVIHDKDTAALHAMYAKLQFKRGLFLM